MMASKKYLTEDQKLTKKQLLQEASELGLDMNIVNKFKTIKISDKITLYKEILKLNSFDKKGY